MTTAMEIWASADLPCYTREDYPRIREIMIDSDLMPATYDSWLECMQAAAAQWDRAGQPLRFWRLEPDAFLAWCKANECSADSESRLAYAESLATADVTAPRNDSAPLRPEYRALTMSN
jgi:hypothetical protein